MSLYFFEEKKKTIVGGVGGVVGGGGGGLLFLSSSLTPHFEEKDGKINNKYSMKKLCLSNSIYS